MEGKLLSRQKVNLLLVTHGLVCYSCDNVDRVWVMGSFMIKEPMTFEVVENDLPAIVETDLILSHN